MMMAALTVLALGLFPQRDDTWKIVREDEGARVAWAEAYLPQRRGRRIVWLMIDFHNSPEPDENGYLQDDELRLIEIRCRDSAVRVIQAFSILPNGEMPTFDRLPQFADQRFGSVFGRQTEMIHRPVIDAACADPEPD